MKLRGVVIATAALGLMAAGAMTAGADQNGQGDSKVKCSGINKCAGKGNCAASDGSHACAGKNSCHGKGWVYTDSAESCTEQGGTVMR